MDSKHVAILFSFNKGITLNLRQGFNVRISGQDVGRATFAHRHAMLVDQGGCYSFRFQTFTEIQDRVVLLNLTPKIEVFYQLFDRSLSIFSMTSLKQHMEYCNFRCLVQLDHPVHVLYPLGKICTVSKVHSNTESHRNRTRTPTKTSYR